MIYILNVLKADGLLKKAEGVNKFLFLFERRKVGKKNFVNCS